jgi:exopolysaccharide biosynthesis protein
MKQIRNIVLLLLSFSIAVGCKKDAEPKKVLDHSFSVITKLLLEKSGIVSEVYKDTTIVIAKGVEETEVHFLKMDGYTTHAYILKVDLKTPGLSAKVATPYDSPAYGGQTIPEMAKYLEDANHKVLAGTNGDFYDIANFVPRGPLHKNGVVLKGTFTGTAALAQQALSFIGILDDGKPYIGYKQEYDTYKNRLKEATGGGVLLMKNGEKVNNSQFGALDPRIAIGYTSDQVMYFVVVDGRDFYHSSGATYADLTGIFYALGTEAALNLDGGGSATMMIRNPLADVWHVKNHPTDGRPRAVSNGWMIIATP